MYEKMTCPHCREEIPRKGCGQHLIKCERSKREKFLEWLNQELDP